MDGGFGRPRVPEEPWAEDAAGLARALLTDAEVGLPAARGAVRLRRARRRAGPEGFESPARSTGRLFGSFRAVLVGLAVAVALWAGELVLAAVFAVFLGVWALFDAVLGRTARQAFHEVARLGAWHVWVVRGGRASAIPATDVVVGDLLDLAAGQVVPADVRLVTAQELVVGAGDAPVRVVGDVAAPAAGPSNVVPYGARVVAGRGRGIALSNGVGPHPLRARLEARPGTWVRRQWHGRHG